MKRTYLFLLPILALFSCGHPDFYNHAIEDLSGLETIQISYSGADGDGMLDLGLVATDSEQASLQSPHFTDSVQLILEVGKENYLIRPRIAPKYFNLDGKITITANTYHDFFPSDWSPLKKRGNYLTYHFYSDDAHFYFIVYDLNSGKEIASYFEFE